MLATYEVRFETFARKKFPEYRIFTTKAESFDDAVNKFVAWANNGEPKFDFRGKEYKFDVYPVTEKNAVSVCRLDW